MLLYIEMSLHLSIFVVVLRSCHMSGGKGVTINGTNFRPFLMAIAAQNNFLE